MTNILNILDNDNVVNFNTKVMTVLGKNASRFLNKKEKFKNQKGGAEAIDWNYVKKMQEGVVSGRSIHLIGLIGFLGSLIWKELMLRKDKISPLGEYVYKGDFDKLYTKHNILQRNYNRHHYWQDVKYLSKLSQQQQQWPENLGFDNPTTDPDFMNNPTTDPDFMNVDDAVGGGAVLDKIDKASEYAFGEGNFFNKVFGKNSNEEPFPFKDKVHAWVALGTNVIAALGLAIATGFLLGKLRALNPNETSNEMYTFGMSLVIFACVLLVGLGFIDPTASLFKYINIAVGSLLTLSTLIFMIGTALHFYEVEKLDDDGKETPLFIGLRKVYSRIFVVLSMILFASIFMTIIAIADLNAPAAGSRLLIKPIITIITIILTFTIAFTYEIRDLQYYKCINKKSEQGEDGNPTDYSKGLESCEASGMYDGLFSA